MNAYLTHTTVMQMRLVQTHMVYGTVLVTLRGKVKELDSKEMERIVMVNDNITSLHIGECKKNTDTRLNQIPCHTSKV